MSDFVIKAKGIEKTFDRDGVSGLKVLSDVNLEVKKGRITVIIGASGAGKSTLLHILGGLDRSDKGSIQVLGQDITKLDDRKLSVFRNKHIGFVFQFHHLLPEFTASENIAVAGMIGGKSYRAAMSESQKLMQEIGLSERADHKPAELSGGEQQRIAFLRAISNSPDIIFADEPTGNLDSHNSGIIIDMILGLKKKGQTFLLVTHNSDLMDIADDLLEIRDGMIHEKDRS
ncbi:MAG: ABC transporter ATP-binding protein [Ignavibacteriales bacterium]|nr:ABC transporter ATP-binding protein [Ignavibacteriales bacterium]MCF8314476.1 ABC transporter ATP-binding protein [Ignavibacteriales bacterium]MCF8436487.1 ABC transporter ATP-binding protein [Ignavibacteriales bacterium]